MPEEMSPVLAEDTERNSASSPNSEVEPITHGRDDLAEQRYLILYDPAVPSRCAIWQPPQLACRLFTPAAA